LDEVSPLTRMCPEESKVYHCMEAKSVGTLKVPVSVTVGLLRSGTPLLIG
jgi:hypothetical protein